MRPAAPDPELVKWLWSAEGYLWHRENIDGVRHSRGAFAEVKDDHSCPSFHCSPGPYSPYADELIFAELREYGISGVPEEWKARCAG